jgi:hypothetical protein
MTNLYAYIFNNEVIGIVYVEDMDLDDWKKKYTMIKNPFVGKKPYEIKYENGQLRNATQQEKTVYLQQLEQAQEVKKREEALKTLGLVQKDLDKIKNLPEV